MSRAFRVRVGLTALLAAFALLFGCGQRGPLTLPESERPVERLDPGKAAPAAGAQAPAEAPTPGAAPRPEDDERRKSE